MHAVFIDRDGVINHDSANYIRTLDEFVYFDHTPEAISVLGAIPLPIVIVTNQSGLARGYFTPADVAAIHGRLTADVAAWGGRLLSIEFCPHHPDDGCQCRKPEPGMFERAAECHDIDIARSYLVGDAPSDIEAGRRLSMTTVRVLTGRGEEPGPAHDHQVSDLLAAARLIAELEAQR